MAIPLCHTYDGTNVLVHHPRFEMVVFRRKETQLGNLIKFAEELYTPLGAVHSDQKMMWTFPQGGICKLTHMRTENDWDQVQGHEVTIMLFDEVAEFSENQYIMATLWARPGAPELPSYIRCTSNPRGPGVSWVKKRFVKRCTPFDLHEIPTGKTEAGEDLLSTRQFIPWGFRQNPDLGFKSQEYEAELAKIPNPTLRKAMLSENVMDAWDTMIGSFFDFDGARHIVTKDKEQTIRDYLSQVPTTRIEAFDYGGNAPTCMLWMEMDPEGVIYVTDEHYVEDEPLEDVHIPLMKEIRHRTGAGEITVADPSIKARKTKYISYTDRSIAQIMTDAGFFIKGADNRHEQGFEQIHHGLFTDGTTSPKIQIFESCINLIEEMLEAVVSDNDPNKISKECSDHAIDPLRYGLMHLVSPVPDRERDGIPAGSAGAALQDIQFKKHFHRRGRFARSLR
jgi:phage terminase large subunit